MTCIWNHDTPIPFWEQVVFHGSPRAACGGGWEGRAGPPMNRRHGLQNGLRAGRPRRGRRVWVVAVRASLHNEPLCKADPGGLPPGGGRGRGVARAASDKRALIRRRSRKHRDRTGQGWPGLARCLLSVANCPVFFTERSGGKKMPPPDRSLPALPRHTPSRRRRDRPAIYHQA